MQIKNKIILIIICSLYLFTINSNLRAEEFNISAIEISIDKKNEIVIGRGSVEVTDMEGKLIKTDKVTYERSKEFLLVEGSVEVIDVEGNIFKSDKATYDKKRERIIRIILFLICMYQPYGTKYKNNHNWHPNRNFNW